MIYLTVMCTVCAAPKARFCWDGPTFSLLSDLTEACSYGACHNVWKYPSALWLHVDLVGQSGIKSSPYLSLDGSIDMRGTGSPSSSFTSRSDEGWV